MRICSSKCEPGSRLKAQRIKAKGQGSKLKGKIRYYRSGSDLTVFLESYGIRDIPVITV
jgi:hypothetical protein